MKGLKKDMQRMDETRDDGLFEALAIIGNHEGITLREIAERLDMEKVILENNLFHYCENLENTDWSVSYETQGEEESKWYLDHNRDDACFLPLTPLEAQIYKSMMRKKDQLFVKNSPIIIKDFFELTFDERKIIQILSAIENKRILSVLYGNDRSSTKIFMLQPIVIYYYEMENLFYVAGLYKENVYFYRLDRFLEIKETKETFEYNEEFTPQCLVENVFGMELGEPVYVKIKFFDEGNVLRKVKRETAHLSLKTEEVAEGIFLEGELKGISKLKAWLRTYGSSAVVFEPVWLREEMLASVRRCHSYYDKE